MKLNKRVLGIIGAVAATAVVSSLATLFAFFILVRQPVAGQKFVLDSQSAVVDAVKVANPAVVAITISKYVPTYEKYYENVPGPWGLNLSIPTVRQQGSTLQEVGGGSGFLISSDGYVLTNRHVVDDNQAEYTVFTNDGKKYSAKVVFRSNNLDLAIVKINGTNFPHLNFGNSDNLQVGQTVIAIGNALAEFRNTVSVGIVSGLSRSITAQNQNGTPENLQELIQTDAAINPGNSGGPLLDLSGNVIGVNVAIADAQNIGFALPINQVNEVLNSIRKK